MKNKNIGYVLLPMFLAAGIILGIFMGQYVADTKLTTEEQKLRTVLGLIKDQYVDPIDIDSLLEKTIPDLLASLDPHSAYISAKDITLANEDLEGSFGGIGVSFQLLNDTVTVVDVISGGPAEEVGLLPGDMILEANGKKLSGQSVTNEDIFNSLRGKEGTTVKVEISRQSSVTPLSFTIKRGQIPSNSVDAKYMLDDKTGYVKVSKFARTTYAEFFQALMELKLKGAEKYIIDLRNNSGGFMDQAIYMINEFLPEGRMIVYTKGRKPENETMAMSDGTGQFQNVPITVLTNEFSASASEIFAGAIQDNDRGLVIGRRSFGKGLVQNQIAMPDSSAIRLTVARYYTPSGRSIQKIYKRGKDGQYELDIADRYTHGEFYSQDSIKLDKTKEFSTVNGRKVYGGGGIMPDIFVPEDTTGYTNYYLDAVNKGLINNFARTMAEKYRPMMGNDKTLDNMERVVPRDNMLLTLFVNYAAKHGLPARWYYINQSRDLLLNQIKAVLARNLVDYEALIKILNTKDNTLERAIKALQDNESPVNIK